MQDQGLVTILPVFKEYTIDSRLNQFRRIELNGRHEFIEFDSTKGRKLIEEISNAKPVPLVRLPEGESLKGKYIGSFPVDWPLSNGSYRQAALKFENQSLLVTLPLNELEKLSIGKTIILEGSKEGIVRVITINQSNKLKI